MLAVIVWIAVEAVRRLLAPSPVIGGVVVAVAAAGLVVNIVSAWLFSGHHSLNNRAALLHGVGDMLGSGAAGPTRPGIGRSRLGPARPPPLLVLFAPFFPSTLDLR